MQASRCRKLSSTFPAFEAASHQVVNLGPAPVEIRAEQFFTFAKADESAILTLSTSSLSLESRKHEQREPLLADVKVGLDALGAIFGPVASKRLGLRYVNIVDREQIAKDLGRPTSWDSLIFERCGAVPAGIADMAGLFACEVASPTISGGDQTVRYGPIKDADGRAKFRLDVDRYVEGTVDPETVVTLLNSFAADIFAVFMASAGPDLRAWMPERRENEHAL